MTRSSPERRATAATPTAPARAVGLSGRTITATLLSGAVVAAAAAWFVLAEGDGGGSAAGARATATVAVERRDLVVDETLQGTLGYGAVKSVPNRLAGTLTDLPAEGRALGRGAALYRVDEQPVVLFYGRNPAWRDLSIGSSDGRDVRQLEANLAALGFDPDGDMTVDGDFTYATKRSVIRWQKEHGLRQTGVVELGRVVFLPGKQRVAGLDASAGTPIGPGGSVLRLSSLERVVTLKLDAALQQSVHEGDKVGIDLPTGRTTEGTIVHVGRIASTSSGDGEATVDVTISVASSRAVRRLVQAPVDITVTSEVKDNVLAAPVTALVSLLGGGYAVEVIENGKHRYVPVEPGLFADGYVEISGAGVREGMKVVVPR